MKSKLFKRMSAALIIMSLLALFFTGCELINPSGGGDDNNGGVTGLTAAQVLAKLTTEDKTFNVDMFRLTPRAIQQGETITGYTFMVNPASGTMVPEDEDCDLAVLKVRKNADGQSLSISVDVGTFEFTGGLPSKELSFGNVSIVKKADGSLSLESSSSVSLDFEVEMQGNLYKYTFDSVSINTERSSVALEGETLNFVLALDWGVEYHPDGQTEEEKLTGVTFNQAFNDLVTQNPGMSFETTKWPLAYQRTSLASAGKFQYESVEDANADIVAGILKLVPFGSRALSRGLFESRLGPCQRVDPITDIVVPSGALEVASLTGLPFLNDKDCLHSRGEQSGNQKTLRNSDQPVGSNLRKNTVSWTVSHSGNDLIFTTEKFYIGMMPPAAHLNIKVPKAHVKEYNGVYYFDGFTAAGSYCQVMSTQAKVNKFKAQYDNGQWLIHSYTKDTVYMGGILPVDVEMRIDSRGADLD